MKRGKTACPTVEERAEFEGQLAQQRKERKEAAEKAEREKKEAAERAVEQKKEAARVAAEEKKAAAERAAEERKEAANRAEEEAKRRAEQKRIDANNAKIREAELQLRLEADRRRLAEITKTAQANQRVVPPPPADWASKQLEAIARGESTQSVWSSSGSSPPTPAQESGAVATKPSTVLQVPFDPKRLDPYRAEQRTIGAADRVVATPYTLPLSTFPSAASPSTSIPIMVSGTTPMVVKDGTPSILTLNRQALESRPGQIVVNSFAAAGEEAANLPPGMGFVVSDMPDIISSYNKEGVLAAGSKFSGAVAVEAAGKAGQLVGGPAGGIVAAAGTQAVVDWGELYVAPWLGDKIYNAAPNLFIPPSNTAVTANWNFQYSRTPTFPDGSVVPSASAGSTPTRN